MPPATRTVTARHDRFAFAAVAAGLTSLFLAYCLIASHGKALWFDEMFTWNMAHQGSWRAYRFGLVADGNPPLGSLLAHFSTTLFGDTATALRLPSIVATCAASWIFANFLRPHVGTPLSLAGMALLLSCPVVRGYAVEARPYGLVLLFTAMGLWSWQRCDPHSPRLLPYSGVACAMAGALLSHHLGLLSAGAPLLAGETVRTLRRRAIDRKMLLAALAGLQALWMTAPLLLASQRLLNGNALLSPLSRPRALLGAYLQLVAPAFVAALLLGVIIAAALRWRTRDAALPKPGTRWPAEEVAALVASLLTLLIAGWVMPPAVTFSFRYAMGTALGFAGSLVLMLRWVTPTGAYALVLCLAAVLVPRPTGAGTLRAGFLEAKPSLAEVESELACIRAVPSPLSVVVKNGIFYPTLYHYAGPALQGRLLYLTDTVYEPGQLRDISQIALPAQRPVFPQGLRTYAEFTPGTRQFLLLDHGRADVDGANLLKHLQHDGYRQPPAPMPGCRSEHVRLFLESRLGGS